MKFLLNTDNCASGIQKAGNISPSKTGSAFLKTMWIKAEKNKVSFMTTDASTEYIGSYPAEVHEEGLIGVPSRALSDLIRNLPSGIIEFVTDETGEKVTISQGSRRYRLPTSSTSWFQDFSRFPDGNSIVWNGESFSEIIDRIAFCIEDSEESAWCYLCIKPDGKGNVVFCGLDGRRFAMVTLINDELLQYLPEDGIKIQKKYLSDMKKLVGTDDIQMVIGNKRFFVRDNDFKSQFSVPMAEVSFIDYSGFVNRVHDEACAHLTVKKDDFLYALSRIAIFDTDSERSVFLRIADDSITVSSGTKSSGSAKETISATCKSEISEIAFITKSLIEILQHMPSDEVAITLSGVEGPAKIQPVDDSSYYVIVMPVQMNSMSYYKEDDI